MLSNCHTLVILLLCSTGILVQLQIEREEDVNKQIISTNEEFRQSGFLNNNSNFPLNLNISNPNEHHSDQLADLGSYVRILLIFAGTIIISSIMFDYSIKHSSKDRFITSQDFE